MTTNTTPTPEVIVWRGIRFEHHSGALYLGNGSFEYKLYRPYPSSGATWGATLFERWYAEGDTAEEALEAARSQVESIARAVGLIPDVEAQRLLDAIVAWREYDETHEPGDPGFTTAPFCRFDMALRDYRKTLAAKLGKGEL